MNPGDRCITLSGRVGTIMEPEWEMPHHHLVKFESGGLLWITKTALLPHVAASDREKREYDQFVSKKR